VESIYPERRSAVHTPVNTSLVTVTPASIGNLHVAAMALIEPFACEVAFTCSGDPVANERMTEFHQF